MGKGNNKPSNDPKNAGWPSKKTGAKSGTGRGNDDKK
jgi:hypothetical protein